MIYIPRENTLVVMVGPAGSGKSTFAARQFHENEIVSSDHCRFLVSDSMENQSCNEYSFGLFHAWIEARLSYGKTVVADATNLTADSRAKLREIARRAGARTVALVIDVPLETVLWQNQQRLRQVPEQVVRKHWNRFQDAKRRLKDEFDEIYFIKSDWDAEMVSRHPVATGFDVIGDVHGCYEELRELVAELGYAVDVSSCKVRVTHPEGRKLVFVGDLTDRGPENIPCLNFAYETARSGDAYWVMGNHDNKLMRALKGNKVTPAHGLENTLKELEIYRELDLFKQEDIDKWWQFIAELPYVLALRVGDKPLLFVSHGGMYYSDRFVRNNKVKNDCLYGPEVEVIDGVPQRNEAWRASWTGPEWIVFGHIAYDSPSFVGKSVGVDIGCVHGRMLGAFRYPELEVITVNSNFKYEEPCEGK